MRRRSNSSGADIARIDKRPGEEMVRLQKVTGIRFFRGAILELRASGE
jgi:hypothetical protein